ncbi:unnamed protein product, partial [Phaeothamnion confervicola]
GALPQIPSRYEHLKAIGKGSYGMVVSAVDRRMGHSVAIKRICPFSAHASDAKHALREIRLMRHLGEHENVVGLRDLFCREEGDELYLVMELLDSDLHRIIRSSQALTDTHHRVFMLQLLRGVKFLHDNGIIHRDLKPGNILVTRNCDLRITDFGLARAHPAGPAATIAGTVATETAEAVAGGTAAAAAAAGSAGSGEEGVDEHMTEHVVTRWYRPPELMLSSNSLYSYPVDYWSVGCVLAELLGRKPLFPGKDFVDQLTRIFDVIGAPRPCEVAHIKGTQAQKFLRRHAGGGGRRLSDLFPTAHPEVLDLLAGLLVFDPARRLTPAAALDHGVFEQFRDEPFKEPPRPAGLSLDFEKRGVSRSALRRLVLGEVEGFRQAQELRRSSSSGGSSGSGKESRSVGSCGGIGGAHSGRDDAAAAGGGADEGGVGAAGFGGWAGPVGGARRCCGCAACRDDGGECPECRPRRRAFATGYFSPPKRANVLGGVGGGERLPLSPQSPSSVGGEDDDASYNDSAQLTESRRAAIIEAADGGGGGAGGDDRRIPHVSAKESPDSSADCISYSLGGPSDSQSRSGQTPVARVSLFAASGQEQGGAACRGGASGDANGDKGGSVGGRAPMAGDCPALTDVANDDFEEKERDRVDGLPRFGSMGLPALGPGDRQQPPSLQPPQPVPPLQARRRRPQSHGGVAGMINAAAFWQHQRKSSSSPPSVSGPGGAEPSAETPTVPAAMPAAAATATSASGSELSMPDPLLSPTRPLIAFARPRADALTPGPILVPVPAPPPPPAIAAGAAAGLQAHGDGGTGGVLSSSSGSAGGSHG